MKIINLESWNRLTHYQFFKRMDYPHYNICVTIDITKYLAKIRAMKLPFYYAFIFTASTVMNQFENYRYRIRGDTVVLHDRIHPSFSDLSDDTDLFKMVTVNLEGTIGAFSWKAKEKADKQTECFIFKEVEGRDDLIYITCIPWVSFTNLSHTISFNPDDSVPRLAWGKYYQEGNKILLPFSVQAHHAFVDGVHMGKYINALQEQVNDTEL